MAFLEYLHHVYGTGKEGSIFGVLKRLHTPGRVYTVGMLKLVRHKQPEDAMDNIVVSIKAQLRENANKHYQHSFIFCAI